MDSGSEAEIPITQNVITRPVGVLAAGQQGNRTVIIAEQFESNDSPNAVGARFVVYSSTISGWKRIYSTSGFNLDCNERDITHIK